MGDAGDETPHFQPTPARRSVRQSPRNLHPQQGKRLLLPRQQAGRHNHKGFFAAAGAVIVSGDQSRQSIEKPMEIGPRPAADINKAADGSVDALAPG